GTAREALAQINSRLYAVPYRKDGRRIVKVGINFDSATRTIGDWVIEVEDTVDNL
ncbi:PD-(D/E)XK nuclease domain-containing protein, partial [Phocaeicola sp. RTP21359st1_C8_RTP21359_211015]